MLFSLWTHSCESANEKEGSLAVNDRHVTQFLEANRTPLVRRSVAYLQGQGCLMHPPRADSLSFQNRSESGCAGLGEKNSRRKDVPKGGLHELLESQVQALL